MTFLPDHRATHRPDEQCDGCRSVEASAQAPRAESRGATAVGVRPDLVIQPGTNRK